MHQSARVQTARCCLLEVLLSAVVPLPSDSFSDDCQIHNKYLGCFLKLVTYLVDENAGGLG